MPCNTHTHTNAYTHTQTSPQTNINALAEIFRIVRKNDWYHSSTLAQHSKHVHIWHIYLAIVCNALCVLYGILHFGRWSLCVYFIEAFGLCMRLSSVFLTFLSAAVFHIRIYYGYVRRTSYTYVHCGVAMHEAKTYSRERERVSECRPHKHIRISSVSQMILFFGASGPA